MISPSRDRNRTTHCLKSALGAKLMPAARPTNQSLHCGSLKHLNQQTPKTSSPSIPSYHPTLCHSNVSKTLPSLSLPTTPPQPGNAHIPTHTTKSRTPYALDPTVQCTKLHLGEKISSSMQKNSLVEMVESICACMHLARVCVQGAPRCHFTLTMDSSQASS